MLEKKPTARSLAEADYPLYCIAVTKDNNVILGGGGGSSRTGVPNGMTIYKWNDQLVRLAHIDTVDHAAMNIALHPDGSALAVGLDENCCIYTLSRTASSQSASSVPATESANEKDEDKNSTADTEPTTMIPSLEAKAKQVTDYSKEPFQKTVCFNSDGSRLLTGGADGVARLWEYPSLKLCKEFKGCETEIRSVAFSPDDSQAVAAAHCGFVYVWSTETGELIRKLPCEVRGTRFKLDHVCYLNVGAKSYLYAVAISVGQPTLMVMWDPRTWVLLRRSVVDPEPCTTLAVSPNKQLLALGTSMGDTVLLHADTLKVAQHNKNVHPLFITGIAFSADSSKVVSISADKQVMETAVALHDGTGGAGMGAVSLWVALLAVAIYYVLLHVFWSSK